jgi:hypothetical protein
MLDTLVVLVVLVAFMAIPLGVGYMTRSSLLAFASAAIVTVPAALLQAFDTNLPGFAVPILALGAIGAITGVATAKRRGWRFCLARGAVTIRSAALASAP